MTLEVYTYSNGDVANNVFNAIATFFATDSFASMLQICAMFAVLATACHFFFTRDTNAIPQVGGGLPAGSAAAGQYQDRHPDHRPDRPDRPLCSGQCPDDRCRPDPPVISLHVRCNQKRRRYFPCAQRRTIQQDRHDVRCQAIPDFAPKPGGRLAAQGRLAALHAELYPWGYQPKPEIYLGAVGQRR